MATGSFPILFFAPARLSDAVMASGLISRLVDEVPGAAFTIVASAQSAPLFREVAGLDRIIPHESESGLGATFRLWRMLRKRRWGLIVDPAGGKMAAGLRAQRRATPAAGSAEPPHKVARAARLLRLEDDPPAPRVFVSDETRARAVELTTGAGPILAVAPGAGWVGAAWPIERFARLATRLLADDGPLAGGRLMMVGLPFERRDIESLRRTTPRERWIDLTAEADPLLIAACLEHARLYVGGAIAWTHLAAAAGAPTLGLYGPTDEFLEGPWGAHAFTVRGPRGFEAIRAADPHLNQAIHHMLDLSVETVFEAAVALIERTRSGAEETHG